VLLSLNVVPWDWVKRKSTSRLSRWCHDIGVLAVPWNGIRVLQSLRRRGRRCQSMGLLLSLDVMPRDWVKRKSTSRLSWGCHNIGVLTIPWNWIGVLQSLRRWGWRCLSMSRWAWDSTFFGQTRGYNNWHKGLTWCKRGSGLLVMLVVLLGSGSVADWCLLEQRLDGSDLDGLLDNLFAAVLLGKEC